MGWSLPRETHCFEQEGGVSLWSPEGHRRDLSLGSRGPYLGNSFRFTHSQKGQAWVLALIELCSTSTAFSVSPGSGSPCTCLWTWEKDQLGYSAASRSLSRIWRNSGLAQSTALSQDGGLKGEGGKFTKRHLRRQVIGGCYKWKIRTATDQCPWGR